MGSQTSSSSKFGNLCGTDYFSKMKEKYGNDAIKFIVVHKCKQLVNTKFSDIGTDLSGAFIETQNKTTKIADQKIIEVTQSFENMKLEINNAVPGGVETLEQSRGETLDNVLKLNKYTSEIRQLKDQTLQDILDEKNRVSSEIRQKHKILIDSIESQVPNIPIYYDMSEAAQKQIMKRGEVEYSAQIESKKESIYRQIDQQIKLDEIKQQLANIIPYAKFEELTQTPLDLFATDTGITKDIIEGLRQM